MQEQARVPAIRFAGFTDAWERRKLGELTTEFIEYITLSSELPLLTSSRAGLMYQNEYRGNLTTDSKETLFSVVPLGACTYRHMSDDDIFHLNINILEKGLVSREYPVFIATGENDLSFIVQHLNSDSKFRAFCAEQKKGGTRTRLYYKTLCEFSVMVPKSAEQNKISSLLLGIDHLITLHQRKYSRLCNVKKSMLEKMFPKDGASMPEIRFAGFTDAWEQRKVSELFRVTRGHVLAATQTETEKTDEKPYPVYSSQTKDKGLMGYYKDYLYEDAITWTTDGANAGTVNYRAGKFYCTNVCGVLLSNEVKANQMIAEVLNNVAKGYVSYVGNPKLMNNVMADIVIKIPTQAEEREQLSSFFASLDNLITLHQRELERLQNIKKACLEKMFV